MPQHMWLRDTQQELRLKEYLALRARIMTGGTITLDPLS